MATTTLAKEKALAQDAVLRTKTTRVSDQLDERQKRKAAEAKRRAQEQKRQAEHRAYEQRQHENEARRQREKDEAFGGSAWFEMLSNEDYLKLVAHLRKEGLTILKSRIFEERGMQKRVRNAFIEMMDVVASTSKTRENSGTLHATLFPVGNDYYPRNHGYVVVTILKQWEARTRTGSLIADYDARDQVTSFNGRSATLKGLIPARDLFAGLVLSGTAKASMSVSTSYRTVDAKVKDLLVLVGNVTSELLTVEDQYFVERISEEYLPTIVKSAGLSKNLDGDARREAESNFMAQLSLMEEKLTRIQQDSANKVLTAVRSQTDFLVEAFTRSAEQDALTI